MGLLALPSHVFSWLDRELLGWMPSLLRLVVWAAISAVASMELYRVISPQVKIRESATDLERARDRLDRHDGSFAEGWTLIRNMLRLSFRRILLIAPGAVIGSLPLLLLVVWMSRAYAGARFLAVGPTWLRGWEMAFFVPLTVFAVGLRIVRRIA